MRVILLGAALCFLISSTSNPDYAPNPKYRSTRFPETRTVSEAKAWLHWSGTERIAFVRGYFVGYRRGAEHGCTVGAATLEPSRRDQTCASDAEHLPSHVQPIFVDEEVARYASAMTTFYEDYPEDDDVPISYLIESLRFDKKSPAQVHNLLAARTP